MAMEFYAQPYDIHASGFYFGTYERFKAKSANLKNEYGEQVEEFEIQFIDGEAIDAELFKALSIHQGNIGNFIDKAEEWDQYDKILIIIAVGEVGYSFDIPLNDPSDFDITIHNVENMRELVEEFVEEGLFGEIPETLANYLDYDAMARDLSYDYTETKIAGMNLVYRTG